MSKMKVIRKNDVVKDENINKKDIKKNEKFVLNKKGKFLLSAQFIFTIVSIGLAIASLINKKFTELFQLTLGLNMIIIGINYKKVYNKPKIVLIYFICGIIFIGLSIIGWFF